MVRLKDLSIDELEEKLQEFQFLDGTIERDFFDASVDKSIKFQFLDGTIERVRTTARIPVIHVFQFLDGTIESCTVQLSEHCSPVSIP